MKNKHRNPIVTIARSKNASTIKHKTEGKGGSRNIQVELLNEIETHFHAGKACILNDCLIDGKCYCSCSVCAPVFEVEDSEEEHETDL